MYYNIFSMKFHVDFDYKNGLLITDGGLYNMVYYKCIIHID